MFVGAMTALVTPMRNGEVDRAALEALVEAQLAAGIDALVPCGTTGESATLTSRPIGLDGTLERLSEEHGILRVPPDLALAVGDHVRILPNHACSVGNLGRSYLGVRNGIIEEVISVDAASAVH